MAREQITAWVSEDRSEVLDRIRRYASADMFRSALASELVIRDDFYRRPLRPEDWDFIELADTTPGNATHLCSLAVNRLLACIHDQSVVRPVPPKDASPGPGFRAFYDRDLTALGESLRPTLERVAFGSLLDDCSNSPLTGEELRAHVAVRDEIETRLSEVVAAGASAKNGMQAMLWLQFYMTEEQWFAAIAAARGRGTLLCEQEQLDAGPTNLREPYARCADSLGLDPRPHAHWQFYLPTTLLVGNHIHRLARDAFSVFRLVGARLFRGIRGDAWRRAHGLPWPRDDDAGLRGDLERIHLQLEQAIGDGYGPQGLAEMGRGFREAARLAELADRDLVEQLVWIRDMQRYRALAERLHAKIENEAIEIDRETFTEPREMCSTTHVHDDHRLVVIESGNMVFWAMPGMLLHLAPGEAALVPQGRLHGSSVESAECVYHQPIIPPAWLSEDLPACAFRQGVQSDTAMAKVRPQ